VLQPPTWRTRSPYLYPLETGWPSYTPKYRVPISVAFYDMHGLQWDYSFPRSPHGELIPSTRRSSAWSLPFRDSCKNTVWIYHLSHACYIHLPSHSPWFDDPNSIWRSAKANIKPVTQVYLVKTLFSSHKTKFGVLKYQVRVKLYLSLTKHHAVKTYWGSGGIAHAFLTMALDVGEWSASRSGRFTPRERGPGVL